MKWAPEREKPTLLLFATVIGAVASVIALVGFVGASESRPTFAAVTIVSLALTFFAWSVYRRVKRLNP